MPWWAADKLTGLCKNTTSLGPRKTQDSYQAATSVVPQAGGNGFGFSRWVYFSSQSQGSPYIKQEQ